MRRRLSVVLMALAFFLCSATVAIAYTPWVVVVSIILFVIGALFYLRKDKE